MKIKILRKRWAKYRNVADKVKQVVDEPDRNLWEEKIEDIYRIHYGMMMNSGLINGKISP